MKTKNKLPIADCRLPIEKPEGFRRLFQIVKRKSKIINGFTLIELLTVIAVIGVLAAFTVPVLHGVFRLKYLNTAKAEMGQLETAIDSYHAAYGFYPPDNPGNPLTNQLYYELMGTTNTMPTGPNPPYQLLDGSGTPLTGGVGGQLSAAFGPGVGGFVNCSKPGSGEDVPAGRNFIHELRPNQTETFGNVTLLVGSVGGPNPAYQPLGMPGLNPWRYVSSNPVNNPGAYELWIQLVIGGKTNLVCNWSKTVQINSPLP